MLTKVYLAKAMVFPVVMYGCESWTIKSEHWRIDAFGLWCWRRLWRVPWTARRSDQSILKEIIPKYSLEDWCWSANTLATWCEELWLIGKDPDAWKDWRWGEKGTREDEMVGWHHQLKGHDFEQTLGDGERQGSLTCCSPWGRKELDMIEWLNNTSCLKRSLSSSLFRPFRVGFEEAMSLSLSSLLFHWFTE